MQIVGLPIFDGVMIGGHPIFYLWWLRRLPPIKILDDIIEDGKNKKNLSFIFLLLR